MGQPKHLLYLFDTRWSATTTLPEPGPRWRQCCPRDVALAWRRSTVSCTHAAGTTAASSSRRWKHTTPVINKWTLVAPMNVKRSRVALVANCGKLYAIGGYDGFTNLNTVEIYGPREERMELRAQYDRPWGRGGRGCQPPRAHRLDMGDPRAGWAWVSSPSSPSSRHGRPWGRGGRGCHSPSSPSSRHGRPEGGVGVGVIPLEPIV